MATHETACPLDCPDGCSLTVEVEGGRVAQITGSTRSPFTAGFICSKVRSFGERLESDLRLREPLVRTGRKGDGEFRAVSWDEAYDRVATELAAVRERSGGEAILPLSYGGSNGKLTEGGLDRRFFRRLGASELARTVCAASTTRAFDGLYGCMPCLALEDYEHAALIVVWGTNPSATGIHFVPVVQRAQAAGAKLVVVDPRRTPLAKKADLHLALRPGTDLPVALAIAGWMFANDRADRAFLDEHTTGHEAFAAKAAEWSLERAAEVAGVAAADLESFARLYSETRPAALRCGWGLERNRNGGSAAAAVLALPAVAGHFGQRAAGFTMSTSSAWGLELERAARVPAATTRTINMNRIGRALAEGEADPAVEAVFVYDHNPLATLPNQELVRRGLEREDLFTVVFDQVMTDTARYADVVLPATTFLEHEDLSSGYGAYALQRVEPVVSPVGEARSNGRVFSDLLEHMGLAEEGDPLTPAELETALLAETDYAGQMDATRIALPSTGARPVMFVDAFPGTPDGRVHLFPAALDAEAPAGLYTFQPDPATDEFPLALISPALSGTISSTFGERIDRIVPVQLSAEDARARSLDAGDRVRVRSAFGTVETTLAISADLRPGTAVLPKGMWSQSSFNGNTANALAPDTLSDVGQNACFNDARVEVVRAEAHVE